MGFGLGSIINAATSFLTGGAKPKGASSSTAAPPSTTVVNSNPNANPTDEYFAYLAGNSNAQSNATTLAIGNQGNAALGVTLQASILEGNRSQMTTYVILGVVMLGVAGLVALSRR